MVLLLLLVVLTLSAEAKGENKTLVRKKRAWILPPSKLMENIDYTHKPFIAKIRSDQELTTKVDYYLSGPGADRPPINLFLVNHETGFVTITGILDREICPSYNLTGVAKYRNGSVAEENIPLVVTVLDQNDNSPYFEQQSGSIKEASKPGTFVMQIVGKDKDQAGHINSEISYSIISQEPAGTGHMFTIDAKTGKVYVKEPTLDRENYDLYKLVVMGRDLAGAPGGRTGTGTVEIKVVDINDNIPTLEKSECSGSVDENVVDVVVMRIKALDKDLEYSDNWVTLFSIDKGNEDNLFSIETDRETNEGILKLIKPVDFEEIQNLELGLLIKNVASFVEGGPGGVDCKIAVNNMPEDPAFIPDTKIVPVSEDPDKDPTDCDHSVPADPDTGKPAENVNYAKAYDPDHWFTIDEKTAEIKLNKAPDKESPFLVNGTYIAKIVAITKDMPAKTATGTIAIQVSDFNDHCPTLKTSHVTLCSNEKTVYVTGLDEDSHPNAAPFTFRILSEGTHGSWVLEVLNETTAALHSQEALWPGTYELQVEVSDNQGLSCPDKEVFHVDVCTCGTAETCYRKLQTPSSELAAPAIGLMFLAMCLLLLLLLFLLYCQCGGKEALFPDQFNDLPFDTKQHLMSYHTEGKGEAVPLQSVPIRSLSAPDVNFPKQRLLNMENYQTNTYFNESVQKFQESSQNFMEVDGYRFARQSFDRRSSKSQQFTKLGFGTQKSTHLYEDMALPESFLDHYYTEKAMFVELGKDGMLQFNYEGQDSCAGSVGCCSLLEPDNDLQFLNDLEPKFQTLADICLPPTPKPSLPDKVVDADLVIDTQHTVETKQANVNTEKVVSSVNVTKPTEPPPMKITQSEVTNISQSSHIHQSSNIHHTATLPSPVQTVVLQQQPVYYTSPMLQPMQYVVQPQMQTTVLLADGAHGANVPGLYVVSGSQTASGVPFNMPTAPAPAPALVMHGFESPKSSASPTRLVSSTQLLPGSINLPQGSFRAEGWKVVGSNTNGNHVMVKKKPKKSLPSVTDPVNSGSSKGPEVLSW
ncbi:Desmoglein-2 Cadherin family member 5 HDGC [Solea senegalensis]|uniref:Desmoglein-2 Cadherin family member 5 HDGC n=1 Tax=Solea senegalensis TaxID=28829 RepID=A0AAV6SEF7_SOLSE|nr:Desmoglein-2 Cadherin family member 5 HDGC [Solea senegalensis]